MLHSLSGMDRQSAEPSEPRKPWIPTPDWTPFRVAPSGEKGDLPRSLSTQEGVGDRLRSAAFAELQAREAFLWASKTYPDAEPDLKKAWTDLAQEEDKHLKWLLTRMEELGLPVGERLVSDQLWLSLTRCASAQEFAIYIASAEERGRKAGVRFYETLQDSDPVTAQIFRQIALEEIAHIQLVEKFFVAR